MNMQTQSIVLSVFSVSLLAALYGCQPEEPAQQPQASSPVASTAQHAATGSSAGPIVSSADAMKLAKDIGCLACHSIEKKLLGPAWKTVAQINRGNPAAEAKLMDKITKGGSGVWGSIAMPAYPDLDEEKNRILVRFILSLE
jgi:cytochrome c551/c552